MVYGVGPSKNSSSTDDISVVMELLLSAIIGRRRCYLRKRSKGRAFGKEEGMPDNRTIKRICLEGSTFRTIRELRPQLRSQNWTPHLSLRLLLMVGFLIFNKEKNFTSSSDFNFCLSNFTIKMPCIITCGRSFLEEEESLKFEDGTTFPPKSCTLPASQISQLEPTKDSFYKRIINFCLRLPSRWEGYREVYTTEVKDKRTSCTILIDIEISSSDLVFVKQ
jgi:hypothetical protein